MFNALRNFAAENAEDPEHFSTAENAENAECIGISARTIPPQFNSTTRYLNVNGGFRAPGAAALSALSALSAFSAATCLRGKKSATIVLSAANSAMSDGQENGSLGHQSGGSAAEKGCAGGRGERDVGE